MSDNLSVLGGTYTILASSDQTGDAYTAVHCVIPPDNGPPPHLHKAQEESFYVLEGTMTFWLDGHKQTAGPGSFVRIPVGRPHTFKNESDQNVTMLFILVPSGKMDQFFRAISGPPTPELLEKVMQTAPQYGVEFVS